MSQISENQSVVRPFDITHREVLRISIPMMVAFLSTPLVGLVATGVIGRLGDEVLVGGVALSAVIFDVIFVTFNFLRGATTGFTAQAVGAGDRREEQRMLASGLAIALVAGLALVVLQKPLGALGLMAMGAQGPVAEAAKTVRGIQTVYINNMQAIVEGNEVVRYRVDAKITFIVQD